MDKHQTENPAGKAIHHFKVVGLLVAAKQKVPPGFSCFTNLVADRIFYWNTMQFGRTEQRVKPGRWPTVMDSNPRCLQFPVTLTSSSFFLVITGRRAPPPAAFFLVYRAVILDLFHRPACIRAESSTAQSLGKLAEGDSAGP